MGTMTPVFGDLTKAFNNVVVTNSDLLAESPDQLAQAFPMLLGVAVGQLTGALSGIALPALAGLQIKPIAITSTDPDADGELSFLSIFANVAVATTPARAARRHQRAACKRCSCRRRASSPSTRAAAPCRRCCSSSAAAAPGRSSTPGRSTTAPGRPSPPRAAPSSPIRSCGCRGAITSTCARARSARPTPTDPTPARVDVLIDTVAPTGSFDVAGNEIRFDATDAVSPPEALLYRFAVDGAAFGAWISGAHATMPLALDGNRVVAQARDEAGNIGALDFHGRSTAPSTSGCSCELGGARGSDATLPMVLVVGFALFLSRRRYVWLRRVAIVGGAACLAASVLAAGGCSHAQPRQGRLRQSRSTRSAATTTSSSTDGTLYVSAYDDTMGDLVYAEIKDPTKNPSWQVIDGVDLTDIARRQGRLSLRHQRSRPRRRPVHLDRAGSRASR